MRAFLNELLDASGEIISHYYHRRSINVEEKSNKTPVTAADRESELAMRKLIASRFPEHGIIGEEFGNDNPSAEYVWVLDPIDGTIAFVHGVPLFVTLIALLRDGRPILGAINQPIAELRCEGDNETAWLNKEIIEVRKPSGIDDATLVATDIKKIGRLHNKQGFNDLFDRAGLFRTWGDGFGYILLAGGKVDIMLDAQMAPWDILPVIPIVRGAKGVITTFSGGDPVVGTSAVSTHSAIHGEVLGILNQRSQ